MSPTTSVPNRLQPSSGNKPFPFRLSDTNHSACVYVSCPQGRVSFFQPLQISMSKQAYAQANKDWLAAKALETDVKPLTRGIYYKVLKQGAADGRHPSPRSIVTVHYTGRTINGKQFDSSRGGTPPTFRLNELIEGWIVAMQQMCVGDRWEIYLPAELGYGRFSQPGIPGGSVLVFDVELISIA